MRENIPPPSSPPLVLIAAAGTGGHIFPGIAFAQALERRGAMIHWLGTPHGMEKALVARQGYPLATLDFSGFRGKSWRAMLLMPLRLMGASLLAVRLLGKLQPSLIIGMGGYITVPLIIANRWRSLWGAKIPAIVHEQNALAGTANRWLARWVDRRLCGFANALPDSLAVGNPVNPAFFQYPAPALRYRQRIEQQRPLSVVVMGGSLGAQALNRLVPEAILIWAKAHPQATLRLTHQCGHKLIEESLQHYRAQNLPPTIQWQVTPFIDNVSECLSDADLLICRAGAQTVSEVAAIGIAALFVPLPWAIDDHQSHNARFLTERGGGTLMPQSALSAQSLADWLSTHTREHWMAQAIAAHQCALAHADEQCAQIAWELLNRH